jgi:hypothetical protein
LPNHNDRRLDINEKAQGIIFDLISIVGAASGVILGIGVIAGIVTGGAALAALAVVGEALAVVAGIVIVFGIIEGAVERDVSPLRRQSSFY